MTLPGMAVFVILQVIARWWGQRALRHLSNKHRVKLVDVVIHFAKVGMIPLVVITVLYWLILEFTRKLGPILVYSYFTILLIHFITLYATIVNRLRSLSLPPLYIREASIGLTIQYLGFTVLFTAILHDLSKHNF